VNHAEANVNDEIANVKKWNILVESDLSNPELLRERIEANERLDKANERLDKVDNHFLAII
jgi:hypothetical protein